jgi:hypothetical protein
VAIHFRILPEDNRLRIIKIWIRYLYNMVLRPNYLMLDAIEKLAIYGK